MKRKPKAYRRAVRKQQVIKQLKIWRENGYATEATSYQLGRALELNASPHFIGILNEMVEEGILKREYREQPGRITTGFYAISPTSEHYHEKYGKRRIVVKHRGAEVGQMELAL